MAERKFVSLQPVFDEKGSVNAVFAVADDGTAWTAKYSEGRREIRHDKSWVQIKSLPEKED